MTCRSWATVFREVEISAGQTFPTLSFYSSAVDSGGLLRTDSQKEISVRQAKEVDRCGAEECAGQAQARTYQARVCGFCRSAAHGTTASGKPHTAGLSRRGSLRAPACERCCRAAGMECG